MSQQWWNAEVSFEAKDASEADRIWDAIVEAACGGEGEPHECKRQVASSLRPIDDEGEDGPICSIRRHTRGEQGWNAGDGTSVTMTAPTWTYSWPTAHNTG